MKRSWVLARAFSRLPLAGWYVVAALAGAGLLVALPGYYNWFIRQPLSQHFSGYQMVLSLLGGSISMAGALLSYTLGVFLFARKRGTVAGLYVSYFLIINGFVLCGPLEMAEFSVFHLVGPISWRLQAIISTPMLLILMLIFPDGKITPARFRWLLPAILALSVALSTLTPNEINTFITWRSKIIFSLTAVLFLLVLGGQVYRYVRVSSPVERQQTKIVVYGIGLWMAFIAFSTVVYFQGTNVAQEVFTPDNLLPSIIWWFSLTILPVAFTLAVVRSHLWDIDVVIRRTLVYGALTAALALGYFGSVLLLQPVIRLVIGHDSPIANVISTLAVAGLFTPLRGGIQSLIDRRFFRKKYNAEQALATFQQRLMERVDLDQVGGELSGIVQATVQPEWVALWIRKPAMVDEDR